MAENESSFASGRPGLRTTGLSADVPAPLRAIVARLAAAGHRALLVGGSVRDLCLARAPVDQDVATSATAEAVLALFPEARPTGERFGSVAVPMGNGLVEVTSFRREGPYSDGRHPDWVAPAADESQDAVRRDFTMNALYLDVAADRLIDPTGGIADLRAALLRAIGPAQERLQEDAIRSLRAARFVARYALRIEATLAQALRDTAAGVRRLSAERTREELALLLCGERPGRGLRTLAEHGLLQVVLPEVPPAWHGRAAAWLDGMAPCDEVSAWASLLHGSAPEAGAAVLERLHAPRALIQAVSGWLQLWPQLMGFLALETAAQARLAARPDLDRILRWHAAGCRAGLGPPGATEAIRSRVAALPPLPAEPLLTGQDVLALGIPPGPRVGELLRILGERIMAGELRDRAQALAALRELAAGRRSP